MYYRKKKRPQKLWWLLQRGCCAQQKLWRQPDKFKINARWLTTYENSTMSIWNMTKNWVSTSRAVDQPLDCLSKYTTDRRWTKLLRQLSHSMGDERMAAMTSMIDVNTDCKTHTHTHHTMVSPLLIKMNCLLYLNTYVSLFQPKYLLGIIVQVPSYSNAVKSSDLISCWIQLLIAVLDYLNFQPRS